MSDVIRNVIIRTRIEAQKAKLEASGAALGRDYERQARAAKEQAKAVKESTGAVREHGAAVKESVGGSTAHFEKASKATRKSTADIISHVAEGMEGVTRFTRGLAISMTSSDEGMQKLLEKLLKFQAAFDIVAGGTKLIKGLGLAFGAAGMAAGGVVLGIGAAAVAWLSYKQNAESAIKATNENIANGRTRIQELNTALQGLKNTAQDFRIDTALTPEEKERRIQKERDRLVEENSRLVRQAHGGEDVRRRQLADILQSQVSGKTSDRTGALIGQIGPTSHQIAKAKEQLTLETQLRENLSRRVKFEKEIAQEQVSWAKAQQGAFNIGMGMFQASPMGLGTAPVVNNAIEANDRQVARTVARIQDAVDPIVDAFEKAAKRVEILGRLIEDVEQAHPK